MPDTLYENQTDGSFGQVSAFTTNYRTQSFTPSITHTITSVDLLVHRLGSPGTFVVDIHAVDGGGLPTGAALATGTSNGDTLTTDSAGEWRNIILTGSPSLIASTQYIIVLRLQNEGLAVGNQVRLRVATGSPYAGGVLGFSFDSGSSWGQQGTLDAAFKEYGLQPPPTKTFAADASVSQDSATKTFTANAVLLKDGETKTFTADVNTRGQKQLTADASVAKDGVTKTFTAGASISQDGLTKTFIVDAHVFVVPDATWPPARAEAYDPDKVWDETNKSWYAPDSSIGVNRMAQAGGRLKQNLVVLSDQGKLYFGVF